MRIVACVSASTDSESVIRYAAQVALRLGAELLAVHIEQPGAATRRAPHVSAQLERNLRLARDLGAQSTVLNHHRVAEAIARFARENDVQRIIVGRPRQKVWRNWFVGDIVAQLQRDLNIMVEIAPQMSDVA